MYKVFVTDLAQEDLENIVFYITEKLKNRSAAVTLLENVSKCYKRLAENPLMYALCNNGRLSEMGYRKVVINHYVLIYRIEHLKHKVIVLRYFYGAENYINHI